MATIVKRGKSWRAQVYRDGHRRSKTFHTKAQAQAWSLQVEIELDDQQLGRIPTDKRFEDALRRYAREVSPKNAPPGQKPSVLRPSASTSPLPKLSCAPSLHPILPPGATDGLGRSPLPACCVNGIC